MVPHLHRINWGFQHTPKITGSAGEFTFDQSAVEATGSHYPNSVTEIIIIQSALHLSGVMAPIPLACQVEPLIGYRSKICLCFQIL